MRSVRFLRLPLGAIAVIVLSVCLASQSHGQAASGNIIGTVTDSSGTPVAGAKVTVRDNDRGMEQTTTSNESGHYSVTNILPGNYKVTVVLGSFKTYVQENLLVVVGTSTTLNVTLQVGAVTETVTVDSAPPLISTDSAGVSTDLTSQQVEELPILNRNFTELELTLPGTSKMPWQHGQTENPQGGIQINANGQLFSGTNFMIDGMANTDPVLGIPVINPTIDSIQETKITTSNFDPEFSQAGGSVIQVSTKSGTNSYHGSLFEFVQNNIFEARDPFTQSTPDPITGKKIPPLHWNQFGGSLGGPIRKDKLFGFFDYQGSRQRNGGAVSARVPTAAERAGDFSAWGTTGGAGQTLIYDPATGNPDGTGRTQFSDPSRATPSNPNGLNIIPLNRIPAAVTNMLALIPSPTISSPGGVVNNNFIASGVQIFNTNQFDVRVDHYLSDKLRYFGRYSYGGFELDTPGPFGKAGGPQFNGINFQGTSSVRNQNGVGELLYTASSSLLGNFRFGVTRYRVLVTAPDESTQFANQVGIPLNDSSRKSTWGLGKLNINGQGGFQTGFHCNCPLDEEETELTGGTNWTKIVGNHTLKGGADIDRRINKRLSGNQTGTYDFDPAITGLNPNASSGLGLASFLLGTPTDFNRTIEYTSNQQDLQWSMFYYAQDTWRATQKLTLTYGGRWDTWFPDKSVNAGQGARYDVSDNLVRISGVGGISSSSNSQTEWHNFALRLGVAYAWNPKTVIRAGYGRSYFEGTFGWLFNNLTVDVYPTDIHQNITAKTPNGSAFTPLAPSDYNLTGPLGTPVLNLAPLFIPKPTIPSNGLLPLPAGITLPYIPADQKIPSVDAWNLTVERALSSGSTLSLAYVGNVGRHLNGGWALNSAVPGPGPLDPRRPLFAKFGLTSNLLDKCDCSNNGYHALQAKFTERFSRNYTALASYTYSKTLNRGEFEDFKLNQYIAMDRGPASYDRTHVFTLAHTALLPFGRGQRIAPDAGRVLNAFIGGWEWTGITTFESGFPFSPNISSASLNSDMSNRPDRIGNPFSGTCANGASTHTAACWFNPAAYATPALYTFGNASRDSLRGPRLFTADWGLDKNFQLTERFKLQFRWEVFNAFNHVNLSPFVNSDVLSGAAGQITDIGSPMRNQQFGLHLTF